MNQSNGKNGNSNGNGNGKVQGQVVDKPIIVETKKAITSFTSFNNSNQAVVLKQSNLWSRGIVWSIIGVTIGAIIWACIANIEQVVTAAGKLKPQGKVKELQVPQNGVIKEVYVKDGDRVEKNQLLMTLDNTASKAQLASLQRVRKYLEQENSFYATLMQKNLSPVEIEKLVTNLKLPKEVTSLVDNRVSLQKENNLFQLQLNSMSGNKTTLSQEEIERLNSARLEANSRASAADLEVKQQKEQLKQVEEKLIDNKQLIYQDKSILKEIIERNKKAMYQAQKSLEIEKNLLKNIEPLLKEGALGEYQVEKQRQQVSDRYKDIAELQGNEQVELDKQYQQLHTHISEGQQLLKEKARLNFVILQAQEKLTNAQATTQKDVRDKIGENNKKIAEIDSSLDKIIVENKKKIAETDSQIAQTKVNLGEQELRAPEKGIVFDLKASPGYVPIIGQDKPVVKIVPSENLIAEVDVTNQDIGFVKDGQNVDVRIDTFPYSEFGDIKGQVLSIASDALPPDETHKFYRFPTRIKINAQSMKINGQTINLQSGMAVTVNIKVKENRTVMSLISGVLQPKLDTLKQVR